MSSDTSHPPVSPLRARMIEDMTVRGFSELSEDYLRLRQVLINALRPFPEARRAAANELHRVEGEIAGKMLQQATPPRPSLATIDLEPAPSEAE